MSEVYDQLLAQQKRGDKAKAEKLSDRELAERRRAYLAFLDRRVPELQAIGKDDISDGLKLSENILAIRRRAKQGEFPGAEARREADREWAVMLRDGTWRSETPDEAP